jgi:hypothetical protein
MWVITSIRRYTGIVPAYCTCGTLLVEDARFCHKCGRPTREEFIEPDEQPEAVAPPPLPQAAMPPAAAPEIGFQNKVAVRIAVLLAGPMYLLINFLAILPAGIFFVFMGLFATGVISVMMYRQRTGIGLSVISGARLGWIAGVFVFVIALVMLTFVFAIANSGDFAHDMQEQLKRQGQSAADIEKVVEFLSNPAAVLMLLATFFVMITTVPSLGGALGAKLFDSKEQS